MPIALGFGISGPEQVAQVEREPVAQVLDAVELLRRGAADHAVHLVALLEQQLGEVGAVLAGDAGDERFFHAAFGFSSSDAHEQLV